jgi:hypothetical protein
MFTVWLKNKILNTPVLGFIFVIYTCFISFIGLLLIEVYYENLYCIFIGINLIGYSLYTTYWILRKDHDEYSPLIFNKEGGYFECIDDVK